MARVHPSLDARGRERRLGRGVQGRCCPERMGPCRQSRGSWVAGQHFTGAVRADDNRRLFRAGSKLQAAFLVARLPPVDLTLQVQENGCRVRGLCRRVGHKCAFHGGPEQGAALRVAGEAAEKFAPDLCLQLGARELQLLRRGNDT